MHPWLKASPSTLGTTRQACPTVARLSWRREPRSPAPFPLCRATVWRRTNPPAIPTSKYKPCWPPPPGPPRPQRLRWTLSTVLIPARGAWAAIGRGAAAATAAGRKAAAGAGAATARGAAGAPCAAVAATGAAATGAGAPGEPPDGPPGGSVGSLIVGAADGLGGKLMRTVSFLGWTFPVSFFGGAAPVGTWGIFSAITLILVHTTFGALGCQTHSLGARDEGRGAVARSSLDPRPSALRTALIGRRRRRRRRRYSGGGTALAGAARR